MHILLFAFVVKSGVPVGDETNKFSRTYLNLTRVAHKYMVTHMNAIHEHGQFLIPWKERLQRSISVWFTGHSETELNYCAPPPSSVELCLKHWFQNMTPMRNSNSSSEDWQTKSKSNTFPIRTANPIQLEIFIWCISFYYERLSSAELHLKCVSNLAQITEQQHLIQPDFGFPIAISICFHPSRSTVPMYSINEIWKHSVRSWVLVGSGNSSP